MSKRTSQVLVSPEGRILKKLREKHGLSMKQAGDAIGVSNSYISQIENGRADCPKGERLKPFLDLYGKIGGSIPETSFTLYTGDILYTFNIPKGSSTGSTFLDLSSKYPKS